MPVALVTGAGGFVGGHLCRHLERRGVTVRRLGRSSPVGVHERSEALRARALEGVDVVYYLAAVAHEGVARGDSNLLHAVNVAAPLAWLRSSDRAGTPRFVFVSSIKVLGDVSAEPLRPDAPYRPAGAYAASKQQAEQGLCGETLEATALAVVRPPLVYGPEVRGNFLALLRLGASPLPLPLARATALRSLVGIGNLCDLLARLGRNGEGIFHVADSDDVCVADLLRLIREQLGRPARLFGLPPLLFRGAASLIARPQIYARLFEPLRVDTSATRSTLGWKPPVALAAQLEETVAWFRSSR
jgi:nucleoside-diphosphate-sugar epimerase